MEKCWLKYVEFACAFVFVFSDGAMNGSFMLTHVALWAGMSVVPASMAAWSMYGVSAGYVSYVNFS